MAQGVRVAQRGGLRHGVELVDALAAARPHVVGQTLRKARVGRHVALRGDHDAGPHLGDVGIGKAAVHADGKNVGRDFVVARLRDALHHGADVGAPAVGFFQQGARDTQRARLDLAGHGALQDVGRVAAGHAHVGVRVGLERHHDVGQVTHLPRDVGVRVQRDGDGHTRPHHAAQARQQFTFAVVAGFGDHGAVQRQQDAVKPARMWACAAARIGATSSSKAWRVTRPPGWACALTVCTMAQPCSRAASRKPPSSVLSAWRAAMA
jgi:hypothetical protein